MRVIITLLVAAVVAVGAYGSASAVVTLYFNEAAYLTDLSFVAANTIFEGFEGADWNASRAVGGVSSVSSQGILWSAGDNVRTNTGWTRTGTYGIFDTFGDPDMLVGATAMAGQQFVGWGGYFATTTASSIGFSLDGVGAGSFGIGANSQHRFFGVIDSDGFNSVAMGSNGHFGGDDFTAGTNAPVPEPATVFLLGTGLVGLRAIARRKRSKK